MLCCPTFVDLTPKFGVHKYIYIHIYIYISIYIHINLHLYIYIYTYQLKLNVLTFEKKYLSIQNNEVKGIK